MSLMVHEFIEAEVHEKRGDLFSAEPVETTTEPDNGITLAAAIVLNVLLVAGIAVNITAAPVLAWIMTAGLVVSVLWSASQLRTSLHTED